MHGFRPDPGSSFRCAEAHDGHQLSDKQSVKRIRVPDSVWPIVLGSRRNLLLCGFCGRHKRKEENEKGKEEDSGSLDSLYLFRDGLQMGFMAYRKIGALSPDCLHTSFSLTDSLLLLALGTCNAVWKTAGNNQMLQWLCLKLSLHQRCEIGVCVGWSEASLQEESLCGR